MRLLSRAALALAAILFIAPALHAQASFSVAAGAAVPTGDFGDAADVGYNITAGVGFKPMLAPVGLRIEGMLNANEFKNGGGAGSRMLAGIVNATLSGAGMPIPMAYLIGGLGMYNMSVTDWPAALPEPESTTKLGFNIGAGINFPLTGISTFLEARYHHITTDGGSTQLIPITFGIKF